MTHKVRRVGKGASRGLDVMRGRARLCPRVAICPDTELAAMVPRGQNRFCTIFNRAMLRDAILPTLRWTVGGG